MQLGASWYRFPLPGWGVTPNLLLIPVGISLPPSGKKSPSSWLGLVLHLLPPANHTACGTEPVQLMDLTLGFSPERGCLPKKLGASY